MAIVTKRKKLSNRVRVNQSEDRISNLPSVLIAHILSFLPIKDIVATSALSTQWKHLWTLVTTLDFEDRLFECHRYLREVRQERFTRFVYRVLSGVSCLHKFRIKSARAYSCSHIEAWTNTALKLNVKEFDLTIRVKDAENFMLPFGLFLNRTLVVLKLGFAFILNIPSRVSLPMLRTLHLNCILIKDEDSVKQLLSGCPVLEELSLRECIGRNVRVVPINVLSLRKLSLIELFYSPSRASDDSQLKILLDAPVLINLEVDDYMAHGYSISRQNDIVRAEIRFQSRICEFVSEYYDAHRSSLFEMTSNVRFLIINDYAVQSLVKAVGAPYCTLPKFHRLTYLELGETSCIELESLSILLKRSDVLETLVLGKGYCRKEDGIQDVPTCLRSHLKFIKIRSFGGSDEERKFVDYFRHNGEVLEKLTVTLRSSMTFELESWVLFC